MSKKEFSRFNEKKAVAAASKLVKLNGGTCDKYWLNKVMYYLERQSLIQSGQPVFFDRLYSVPYGPIVSAVNDGINASSYDFDTLWSQHFELNQNNLILKKEADDSVLSPFEDQLISEMVKKFKGWSFAQLKNFFHNLPEYKETGSREDISYEEILIHEGFSAEDIQEIIEELRYLKIFEDQFSIGT